MVGTSIALLQERFRQLQKDKQRREKKELLNLLSESNRVDASIMHLEPNGSSTSRDMDSNSLSLGLNLQNAGKQVDIDIHEARLMPGDTKFWPGNSVMTKKDLNLQKKILNKSNFTIWPTSPLSNLGVCVSLNPALTVFTPFLLAKTTSLLFLLSEGFAT
ncbi:unnamed protein product [Citrullus colocynthis]|uniref:Uncharacterized protein n=1 Tax=Citrullus colocynthis TaxID=252529 RepID=A0ABP0Y6V0_9ROSI